MATAAPRLSPATGRCTPPVDEAITLVEDMLDDLDALEGVEVVLCPPFVSLAPLWEMVGDTAVALGAQNTVLARPGRLHRRDLAR